MSIYDFLCMPFLDKVTVQDEPHGLDTSIFWAELLIAPHHLLQQALLSLVLPHRKLPLPDPIAARDKVEQADSGTLDDDDQHNGSEFVMEGIESLNGVSQDASPHAQEAAPTPDAQPLDVDVDAGADEIASDGSGSESTPYTKEVCEEIHGVNLGRRKKELYKDPKVSRLMAQLGVLKSRCQTAEHKLSSWDKKHRKYWNEKDALVIEKEKIEEELVETKSQLKHRESGEFNWAFEGVLNKKISVGVERGLRMDRTDKEFKELSQRVVGFVPDAKEKFDRVVAAFLDTTFPFLDKTFGHTSTLKHLKKKKKPIEKRGPSAV
uniref:Uncharacterized protein n=1 Tax=Tanacetum cinerariifolium TaxID=118510 RepID=A0A6L2L493_TANCI|nr:hypothetical protein [Tanacetum cinerariifolium]